MQSFEELGLSKELLESLSKLSINTPTEIQEFVIPSLLTEATDLLGLAPTGTGKTAAFGLPLLDLVDPQSTDVQAVILAPTRELAQQIAKSLSAFASLKKGVNIEVVYGGAPITNQIKALKQKRPQIIIATPGRLKDMLQRKVVFFDAVRYFVLDEADEMLNMGFKEDIYQIMDYAKNERNIWLFSATMAKDIRTLVKTLMHKPIEYSVKATHQVNANIIHQYCTVKNPEKQEVLERFIDAYPNMYGVVFCRTRRDTKKLSDTLNAKGYRVDALHGDLNQNQRDEVMRKFRKKITSLLIATDVAARGIDVEDLTHVFHFALPDDMSIYTHRSGRTARAGKEGLSIAIVNRNEERKLIPYSKSLKLGLSPIDVPQLADVQSIKLQSWLLGIGATEINEKLPDSIYEEAEQYVSQIGIDVFIKKLVSKQLAGIKESNKAERSERSERSDRGAKSRKSDNRKGREESSKRDRKKSSKSSTIKSADNADRYFINIGEMDDTDVKELKNFLCDVSKVAEDKIGNIHLSKRHSFFDVEKSASKSFAQNFKDLVIDGRALRVNRDEEEGKGSRPGKMSKAKRTRR